AMASTSKFLAQMNKTQDVGQSDPKEFGPNAMQSGEGRTRRFAPLCQLAPAFNGRGLFRLGSNEATYGLRESGAGFHRNRPAAGKAKPTLSAGIVRRVRNADGGR